jgi:hypothetical protein
VVEFVDEQQVAVFREIRLLEVLVVTVPQVVGLEPELARAGARARREVAAAVVALVPDPLHPKSLGGPARLRAFASGSAGRIGDRLRPVADTAVSWPAG